MDAHLYRFNPEDVDVILSVLENPKQINQNGWGETFKILLYFIEQGLMPADHKKFISTLHSCYEILLTKIDVYKDNSKISGVDELRPMSIQLLRAATKLLGLLDDKLIETSKQLKLFELIWITFTDWETSDLIMHYEDKILEAQLRANGRSASILLQIRESARRNFIEYEDKITRIKSFIRGHMKK